MKRIILFILLCYKAQSKSVYTEDVLEEFTFNEPQKLDFNIDILDGVIDNSYVKPAFAKTKTIVYILDTGCYPLVKSFVRGPIGYHGVAVKQTMEITLPVGNTQVRCIKTLPARGMGTIDKYAKALRYIVSRKHRSRVIINISASVSDNSYVKINRQIRVMANKGYEFVISAGNLGRSSPRGPDACLYSLTNLAPLKNVYIVSSFTPARTGKCVEYLYAGFYPSIHPFSGTSFSAPIFAGLLTNI